MYPGPADLSADVLPRRYRPPAPAASLPGGPGRIAVPSGRGIIDRAEPDRPGVGHGEPGAAWAEVIQMGLDYPLADRHPLAAVPASALSHRDPLQSP
jgi:hypothetical protein